MPEALGQTALQVMSFDHPAAIDFINWSSIRDQLIFKAGKYNLDRMVNDIVSDTVIDIQQFRAPINIHDTFITHVFSFSTAGSFDSKLNELFESRPGVEADGQEVIRKITQRSGEMEGAKDSKRRGMALGPEVRRKNLLAVRWGLHKLPQWKLSKEFAVLHPEIDCSLCEFEYNIYKTIFFLEAAFGESVGFRVAEGGNKLIRLADKYFK
jgi:hypothetical protein